MTPRVLVAGAGISGLSACLALLKKRPDLDLCLVESRERTGGNIHTLRENGYVIEAGPDSFLRTKPEAPRLCAELGLGPELIAPSEIGRRVLVAHRGRLEPMPGGMALAIPTRVGPMVSTPLLSIPGKLRILGDLLVEKPKIDRGDESVASFLERHFGKEATEYLGGPLLGGIFAGDIDELSILSTFPQLVELEKKSGSLIRAMFATERERAAKAQNAKVGKLGAELDDPLYPPHLFEFLKWLYRQGKKVESPFQSLRGGMSQLVEKVVERLPASSIELGIALNALEPLAGHRWRAHFSRGSARDFEAVLLCLPAHAAADVVPDASLVHELRSVPHVSTANIFFAFDGSKLPRPLDASGYIVPRGEGRSTASTWVSTKWEARAPAEGSLIRVFLGGAREPKLITQSSDADLVAIARAEIEKQIGRLPEPQGVWTFRHVRPQPVVGHLARMTRVENRLAELPGLFLSSSAFGGVGISDCIRRAESAAQALLLELETLATSASIAAK